MENSGSNFTEQALRAIVRKAMERNTGARALRSVIGTSCWISCSTSDREAGLVYTIPLKVISGAHR